MKQKSKKHFWIYASLLALVFLCLSAHGGTMLNNNDNGAGSLHYGMANATTDKSHPDKDHDHDHDCPTTGVTNFWALGGNAGTKAGSNFLGTTDNQPLELKVNGQRALRFEPNTNGAPNILGGSPANRVGPNPNAVGVTIAGGGAMSVSPFDELFQGDFANVADSYFATIGGGFANKIQMNTPTNATSNRAIAATIAGGYSNTIAGQFAAIGGGSGNTVTANGGSAAIAGGYGNSVSGGASTIAGGTRNNMAGTLSSIGGGSANTVEFNSYSATIAGGSQNLIQTNAQAATIGGGQGNTIQSGPESNFASTIAGGGYNSIATGANYSSIGGSRRIASSVMVVILVIIQQSPVVRGIPFRLVPLVQPSAVVMATPAPARSRRFPAATKTLRTQAASRPGIGPRPVIRELLSGPMLPTPMFPLPQTTSSPRALPEAWCFTRHQT